MSNYQYRKINDFGKIASKDPVGYCLFDDVDTQFDSGVLGGKIYGPYSPNCQLMMADRCAKKWDKYCEVVFGDKELKYPNVADVFADPIVPGVQNVNGSLLTAGQQLLKTSAQRRFCDFRNCNPTKFSFEPTDPTSPILTQYDPVSSGCVPVCNKFDVSTIDNDIIMNKCMQDPIACNDVLQNVCNTAKRTNRDLGNTRLGQFCRKYF